MKQGKHSAEKPDGSEAGRKRIRRIKIGAGLGCAALVVAACAFFAWGWWQQGGRDAFRAVWMSTSQAEEETEQAALDPLTGSAAAWEGQRPVAVTISNAAGATRQWGLAEASVVLETLTEGRSTSLCLVYPAVEAVPKVGPVAQGQDVYAQLLAAQNVLPVQKGATVYARNYQAYYAIQPVDALEVGTKAFAADASAAYPDEFAWYTSGAQLAAVLPSLGLSALGDAQPLTVFGTPAAAAEGAEASTVQVRFSTASASSFAYDAAQGAYRMSRTDGTPQVDANTGTQASFTNLLVLSSAASLKDDGYTRQYDLTGGTGVYFTGGGWQRVAWSRSGEDMALALYDEDGKPLALARGRSYIALLGGLEGQSLTAKDASGTPQELQAATEAAR
jgi:hypothetical protein